MAATAALSAWQVRHCAGAVLAGVCGWWHERHTACFSFGGLNSPATFSWHVRHCACATPGDPWNVWQFLQSPWCGMCVKGLSAVSKSAPWHFEHALTTSEIRNWCGWWHEVQTRCLGGPAVWTAFTFSA